MEHEGPRGMLSRLRELTSRVLEERGYEGDELVLEALLRRGFLAFREGKEVFLAEGSHRRDVQCLARLADVGPGRRPGSLKVAPRDPWAFARAVCGVAEHRSGFTCMQSASWPSFRRTVWGAKVSVGPDGAEHGGLDVGVALLVKSLPLVRVATSLSCDGHGERDGHVRMRTPYDVVWLQAVFEALEMPLEERGWRVEDQRLVIPVTTFDDAGLTHYLDDVQRVARRFLDHALIRRVGEARRRLVAFIPEAPPPSPAEVLTAARRALAHL